MKLSQTFIIGIFTIISMVVFVYTYHFSRTDFSSGEIMPPQFTAKLSSSTKNKSETKIYSSRPSSEIQPARLIVPALGVDTAVEHVGITAKGNMGTPKNFENVAWYKYGAVPGEEGSAVIVGHVVDRLFLPSVFNHLDTLKKRDDIYVIQEDGQRVHFIVTAVETFDYEDIPLETIFNQKGAARLRLITCTGDWVQNEKTYNQRVVVTAVKK
jgi:LPXTG-site transpeptidase (sortase) family protein